MKTFDLSRLKQDFYALFFDLLWQLDKKKKKWSKGKIKEKSNNQVFLDKNSFEKIVRELLKFKFISPSILTEKFRISCSLSRRLLKELLNFEIIRKVSKLNNQIIYTRNYVFIGSKFKKEI